MIRAWIVAFAAVSQQRHSAPAQAELPAARSQLRDITGIETVPVTLDGPNPIWIWLSVACVAISLILIVVIWRRRSRIPMKPSPHVQALQSLALLAANNLEMNSGSLHEQIADILRAYIQERFDVRASQRTSEELLVAVAAADAGSIEARKKLAAVAERCDLAKFAGVQYSVNDGQLSVHMAREFVLATS